MKRGVKPNDDPFTKKFKKTKEFKNKIDDGVSKVDEGVSESKVGKYVSEKYSKIKERFGKNQILKTI